MCVYVCVCVRASAHGRVRSRAGTNGGAKGAEKIMVRKMGNEVRG